MIDLIKQGIEQGLISQADHPSLPLWILNYTPRCQYERLWNPATLMCRGLIVTYGWEIVQRPFGKFFNYGEPGGVEVKPGPIEVTEKLDGSLGILYEGWRGDVCVATRGSFTSDQAIRANQIISRKYPNLRLVEGETYLVEIIYPENRIVVDYSGLEDLVLIAIIDKKTGLDLPLRDVGLPIVKRYENFSDLPSVLSADEEAGREGYVVKFHDGSRLKIKFPEYMRLHRLMTGMNSRDVWEALREGKPLPLENVPDEFYSWLTSEADGLRSEYARIESEAREELKRCVRAGSTSRRDLAERILASEHAGVMFRMLDGKDYSDTIWKRIRPSVAGKPFSSSGCSL